MRAFLGTVSIAISLAVLCYLVWLLFAVREIVGSASEVFRAITNSPRNLTTLALLIALVFTFSFAGAILLSHKRDR